MRYSPTGRGQARGLTDNGEEVGLGCLGDGGDEEAASLGLDEAEALGEELGLVVYVLDDLRAADQVEEPLGGLHRLEARVAVGEPRPQLRGGRGQVLLGEPDALVRRVDASDAGEPQAR